MLALICKHGIAIARDSADAASLGSSIAQRSDLSALPNSTIPDEDAPNEHPITVALQPADLADFGRGNSFAVTYFGPKSLAADKTLNEDFALAGVVDGRDEKLSFGIVADGVTTKTFWPARSSRIAAFAGYEVLKRFARDGWSPKQGTADDIGPFLNALCETVNRRFDQDRKRLREAGAVPTRWDAKLFEQHSERTGFWYQTTLLLVVIGRAGGWLLFCGDGGAVRFFADGKRIVDAKTALESGESLELATSVGIGVSAQHFTRAFIRPAPAGNSLHVVLASDGIDRTLQRTQPEAGSNRYGTLDLRSQAAAETAIQALAELPDADRDNMSVAHVCFPPDSAWPTEKVVPIVVPAVQAVEVPAPPIAPSISEPGVPQPEVPQSEAPQPGPNGSSAWLVIAIAIVALIVGASAGILAAATAPGSRLVGFFQAPFGIGVRHPPATAGPSEAGIGRDSGAPAALIDVRGLASTAQPGPAKSEAAAKSSKPPDAPPSASTAPAASAPAAPSPAPSAPPSVIDRSSNPAPAAQPKGDTSEPAPPRPGPAEVKPNQPSTGLSGG